MIARRRAACRLLTVFSSAVAASALLIAPLAAQSSYPRRAITLIVPFAAGGPTDAVAHAISERMGRALGRPVVIDNVAGVPGITGSVRAKRAAPDGYTIIMGHIGTHAVSVALVPNLAYDPATDFEPIGKVSGTAMLVLARKDLPPKDLKQFADYAQANAGTIRMAHAGVGSISFPTCLLLNHLMKVKPRALTYPGNRPAMEALVRGQADYMCDQVVNVAPQVRAGTVKAFAIAGAMRNPMLPAVPNAQEAGMPEFDVSPWNALFAPKGTPQPILDKLTAALDAALDDERTRKRLTDLGNVVPGKAERGQQALATLVRSEIARWTPIVKAAGPLN